MEMATKDSEWHALSPTTPSKPSAEHLVPGLYALARCWYDRGDLAPAEKIYRLILNIDDRVKNITAGEVVLSSLDLARMLTETDHTTEAEHLFLRTLNRCMHLMGQEHPVYTLTLREYAKLLRKMNLEHEAEALDRRVKELNKIRRGYAAQMKQEKSAAGLSDSGVMSATMS
jgi:hypothetical protein